MTSSRYIKKSEEVHEAISKLFAHKGYSSTSIRDIAAHLGMNKSTLYHYMGNKEKALFTIMYSGMELAVETLKTIASSDLPAEERLKEVLSFYTRRYCSDPERILLLAYDFRNLNETHQRLVIEKQRQVVNLFKGILYELASDGKLKGVRPAVAAFAFFGMAHHTVNWFKMDGSIGLKQLANDFVEIFTRGVFK